MMKTSIYKLAGSVIREQLGAARRMENRIIADKDPENLHDFRVALRRSRSLLNPSSGIFSEGDSKLLGGILSLIMNRTNRLRDLDVFISDIRSDYIFQKPELQKYTETGSFLLNERRSSAADISEFLSSGNYRKLMRMAGHSFKRSGRAAAGKAAELPAGAYLSERAVFRYEDAALAAEILTPESPFEHVHRLRIACKKLRYLISISTAFCESNALLQAVDSLKAIQDCLGRFNDYSIQLNLLSEFDLPDSSSLVSLITERRAQCRNDVDALLGAFFNDTGRDRIENLYSV